MVKRTKSQGCDKSDKKNIVADKTHAGNEQGRLGHGFQKNRTHPDVQLHSEYLQPAIRLPKCFGIFGNAAKKISDWIIAINKLKEKVGVKSKKVQVSLREAAVCEAVSVSHQ